MAAVKGTRPPNAGKGRPKGVPNKLTTELKDMILQALSNKGGVVYLEKQADENPHAFLTLVGKVLPLQVTGENGKDLIPPSITFAITQAPNSENQT
jgi:hypothetical protein